MQRKQGTVSKLNSLTYEGIYRYQTLRYQELTLHHIQHYAINNGMCLLWAHGTMECLFHGHTVPGEGLA